MNANEIVIDEYLVAVTTIVDESTLDERGNPRRIVIKKVLIPFDRVRPYMTDVPLARPARSPRLDD
jgi:hypothetical protein